MISLWMLPTQHFKLKIKLFPIHRVIWIQWKAKKTHSLSNYKGQKMKTWINWLQKMKIKNSISFKNKYFVQYVHIFKLHCFPWWIFQCISQSPGVVSMTRCSHNFYGKEECQEYSWRGQICNTVETVWEFLISVLFIGSQYQISSRKDLSSRIKTTLL